MPEMIKLIGGCAAKGGKAFISRTCRLLRGLEAADRISFSPSLEEYEAKKRTANRILFLQTMRYLLGKVCNPSIY